MSVNEMRVTRFKRRVYFEECLEQVVLEYLQTTTNFNRRESPAGHTPANRATTDCWSPRERGLMPRGVLHVFVAWVISLLPDSSTSDAERRLMT